MKILRVCDEEKVFYVEKQGDVLMELLGEPYDTVHYTGRRLDFSNVRLLAPCTPTKIVAVGLNYAKHANELGMKVNKAPIIFLKPSTSIIAHGDNIILPEMSKQVDYEGELAVVIGKECKAAPIGKAKDYIFGYTCLNDVTARDLQKIDGQWTRSKSFDTFCPFGPSIETEFDPSSVKLQTYVNGEIRQDGNTNQLIFNVFELVSFISGIMTLLPGDIIATGTPEGVGKLSDGDQVIVKIIGLDSLCNVARKKT